MAVNKSFTHQAIALAGVAQAATLVQQLATTGKVDAVSLEASVGSLLKLHSHSVADVYGGIAGVGVGLTQLQQYIIGYEIKNREQARYAASLVFLEQKLAKEPQMLKKITQGIERVQTQVGYFDLTHENILASLGELYTNTLSQIQPRIMVHGDQTYLQQKNIIHKIRALLLAGVRSALLWRQCGGARWKFLFYRSKLQQEVKFLLTQV